MYPPRRYLGTRSENLGQRHAIGWDMGFGGGGIVLSGMAMRRNISMNSVGNLKAEKKRNFLKRLEKE